MSSEQINPFHGDKKDENPENFMRSFHRRMGTANDDVKKQQFRNFLEVDSAADEWFDTIDQNGKKDWTSIKASFRKRWPRKKTVKKMVEEYEQEITSLRLNMEDLGKKAMVAGKEVYAHITWADNMEAVVIGAKLETTMTFIGHVRRELPKLLREKVGTHGLVSILASSARHRPGLHTRRHGYMEERRGCEEEGARREEEGISRPGGARTTNTPIGKTLKLTDSTAETPDDDVRHTKPHTQSHTALSNK
jgi:hypothetical protein